MSFDFSHLPCSQIKVHENLHSARIFLLQIFLKQSSAIAFNNAIFVQFKQEVFVIKSWILVITQSRKHMKEAKNFISCVMNVIFDPHFWLVEYFIWNRLNGCFRQPNR